MHTDLEFKAKKQSIIEARINAAQYYQANKCFEYSEVPLMEISYIFHSISNNTNDNNLCATHNKLIQIMIENDLPDNRSDIILPPYFETTRIEHWVNNKIASELLDELFKNYKMNVSNSSNKTTYRGDAIAIAVINHILPALFPDKENIAPDKNTAWNCFIKLEEALLKDGAKQVKLYRETTKDNSSIAGTDRHDAEIDCSYNAFRGRLRNLIAAYKQ